MRRIIVGLIILTVAGVGTLRLTYVAPHAYAALPDCHWVDQFSSAAGCNARNCGPGPTFDGAIAEFTNQDHDCDCSMVWTTDYNLSTGTTAQLLIDSALVWSKAGPAESPPVGQGTHVHPCPVDQSSLCDREIRVSCAGGSCTDDRENWCTPDCVP